jgi:phosphomannomutase
LEKLKIDAPQGKYYGLIFDQALGVEGVKTGANSMTIKFGTDGWRAVIGEDYTYDNVRKIIQAFCDLNEKDRTRGVILGYDRRFCSKFFAEAAAQVLLGNGFKVLLSEAFCPTPCISWMTKKKKALAGIVITASHNPFQWNGVKFKESDGGSASPEYTGRIEDRVVINEARGQAVRKISLAEGSARGLLKEFHPHGEYLQQLRNLIDLSTIRRTKIKIVADPIFGAGSGFYPALLGSQVLEIRGEDNPGFGGVHPEPIEKNLKVTAQRVRETGAGIALATDGDADRIGAMDEKGRFINSHQIFSLILRHLVTVKKWKGDVVKTVSTTQMIDRLGEKYGLNVIETPIGFKYICQEFRKGNPLMGGEESGGLGFAKHVYERDGLLSGLFLLEIMAHHRKPLSQIIKGLQREVGPLYFLRDDIHLDTEKIQKIKKRLGEGAVPRVPGVELKKTLLKDGFKYVFSDGSWLLIRPSGTEPLLRVYAEAPSLSKTSQLIQGGRRFLSRV